MRSCHARSLAQLALLPLLSLPLAAPAWAAPMIVELTAEASRPAANDLVRATVSAEAAGATPGELS
jgi:predicted secreted protein